MKKFLVLTLLFIMLFSSTTISSFASNNTTNNISSSDIMYFEDGSYIYSEITEFSNITRSSNTKSGKKTIYHCNADNDVLWTATVVGTFSYNGSSATCTNASVNYEISDSNWEISSATATKSTNNAIGNITAKKYILGICVQTVNKSVTLTCSATGVLS